MQHSETVAKRYPNIMALTAFLLFFLLIFSMPIEAKDIFNITNSTTNNARSLWIGKAQNGTLIVGAGIPGADAGAYKSETNGFNWTLQYGIELDNNFLVTQNNLWHGIFELAGQYRHMEFNISNNTASVSPFDVIQSSAAGNMSGGTFFIPRRNGNLTLIAQGLNGRTLRIFDSGDNGKTWVDHLIPDNASGANAFSGTETPDGTLYIFKNGAHTSGDNWNVTNISSTYGISQTINLLTNKANPNSVASTSSLNGEIYATFSQSLTPSVIWFSKMGAVNKSFSTPKVIINASDIDSHEIVFDVASHILYLIYGTQQPLETKCVVYSSFDDGETWNFFNNFTSVQCQNRGQWIGRFPWDRANQLNSSRTPLLEGVDYNTVNGVGYSVTFENMTIESFGNINSGEILGTDINNIFFDFETGTGSITNFTGADLRWSSDDTLIDQLGQPFTVYSRDNNNNLPQWNTIDCRQAPESWIIGKIFPNNPAPPYYLICFNLSSQHFGLDTYGAIKIINNTNVRGGSNPEFDFWWAYFPPQIPSAPTEVLFSNIVINPNPPQQNQNLTFNWLTSYPTTTQIYFRTIQGVVISTFTPIFADQNLSTYHNITISKDRITKDGLSVILSGLISNGQEFNSSIITLFITPTSNQTTPAPSNRTMQGAVDNIVNSGLVENATQATYLLGAILLIALTSIGFVFGGFKMGLAVLISMLHAETVIGWLPLFMLIPILVLDALFITMLIRRVFAGEAGN